MAEAPKQEELINKTEDEKKVVRQTPKYFKKLIRQFGILEEEEEVERIKNIRKEILEKK